VVARTWRRFRGNQVSVRNDLIVIGPPIFAGAWPRSTSSDWRSHLLRPGHDRRGAIGADLCR
jgi:hypothetical protein